MERYDPLLSDFLMFQNDGSLWQLYCGRYSTFLYLVK